MVQNRNVYLRKKENNEIKVEHKYSQEDYEEKRQELTRKLEEIQKKLENYIESPLKSKMVSINIQNISNAIEYYYNIHTAREMANINKIYNDSARQIVKITRFVQAGDLTDDVQKHIFFHLSNVIQELQNQRKYIADLERNYHNLMRAPPN